MAKLTLSNPTIPVGSTILVTAANGLVASHVVDQLLAAGYHVRGTVRSPAKCAWMAPLYNKRHGSGRFELIQVSQFENPEDWDAALTGVAGIAHVIAGGVNMTIQDVDKAVQEDLPMQTSILEAAKKTPSVKSFVLTSSAWAAWSPNANKKVKLTKWSWNEEAIELARSDASPEEKGLAGFMALKTRLEQGAWDWVKKEKPSFNFNSILLDLVIGECLDPVNQGLPSTAGMVHWVWTGSNRPLLNMMQPQWHIDARDAGILFVAALTSAGVNGERIYGFGDRYSWYQVREILKQLHPNKEIVPVEYHGVDQTDVPNQRGEELLRGLGQKGWTSLEDSVKATAESFLRLEGNKA
ncbi:hypothetical protein BJ170DRAFT_620129 [Xylariales sp. AK1849]|nr:hypothetical protein BJ170DRAFT_620129 [Xylariales sp. AK1849]